MPIPLYDDPSVAYDDSEILYGIADGIESSVDRPRYWRGFGRSKPSVKSSGFTSVVIDSNWLSVNGQHLETVATPIRFAGEDDVVEVEARFSKLGPARNLFDCIVDMSLVSVKQPEAVSATVVRVPTANLVVEAYLMNSDLQVSCISPT